MPSPRPSRSLRAALAADIKALREMDHFLLLLDTPEITVDFRRMAGRLDGGDYDAEDLAGMQTAALRDVKTIVDVAWDKFAGEQEIIRTVNAIWQQALAFWSPTDAAAVAATTATIVSATTPAATTATIVSATTPAATTATIVSATTPPSFQTPCGPKKSREQAPKDTKSATKRLKPSVKNLLGHQVTLNNVPGSAEYVVTAQVQGLASLNDGSVWFTQNLSEIANSMSTTVSVQDQCKGVVLIINALIDRTFGSHGLAQDVANLVDALKIWRDRHLEAEKNKNETGLFAQLEAFLTLNFNRAVTGMTNASRFKSAVAALNDELPMYFPPRERVKNDGDDDSSVGAGDEGGEILPDEANSDSMFGDEASTASPAARAPIEMVEPLPENLADALPSDSPLVREVYGLLRESDLAAKCRFLVLQVLRRVHYVLDTGHDPSERLMEMWAGGKTQIGKTLFKLCVALLAARMGHPVAIVTIGADGVKQLMNKFNEYSREITRMWQVNGEIKPEYQWAKFEKFRWGQAEMHIQDGGIVVMAYLQNWMEQLGKVLSQLGRQESAKPPVLILDEADEMYCPVGVSDKTKREQYLKMAMTPEPPSISPPRKRGRLRPGLLINVSATLLPLLLDIRNVERPLGANLEQGSDPAADIVEFKDADVYHGVDKMQVLQVNGRDMYLDEDEDEERLGPSNSFVNPALVLFLKEAVKRPDALILDITDPRVHAAGGIFSKAEILRCTDGLHGKVAIVAMSASEVQYYPPAAPKNDHYCAVQVVDKDARSGKSLITKMEQLFPNTAILIIGMTRGESFRNATRVPTHIVCALSKGLSLERMVQAAGRATGMFPMARKEEPVKVLTRKDDFELAKAYAGLMGKMCNALESPEVTRREALRLALNDDPEAQAYWKIVNRPVGAKKWNLRPSLMEILMDPNQNDNGGINVDAMMVVA